MDLITLGLAKSYIDKRIKEGEIATGATPQQAAQIEQNKTDITDLQVEVDKLKESGGSGSGENAVLYTEQELTAEQQEQARTNIGAISREEVEELLGIEEEFSITGDLVEFDVDVEPDTELEVISRIHRDETWGLSDKLVLHQVSGTNFADLSSYLGGAGTVFEKNGLTATINDDSTVTIQGTNESSDYTYILSKNLWSGEPSDRVYPAGTYTIPGFTIRVRSAQYPNNIVIDGVPANLSGTVTIPEPFRIILIQKAVKAGETVDMTIPLGLFRDNSVPETGYEYQGQLHTVTFDAPVYEGEFNWTTGELKDVGGNTVGYYESQPIKRLPGVNYFWTGFGENVVSNKSNNDLEKVIIRLGEVAPAETVSSICDFTLTPTTPNAVYSLHSSKVTPGGTSEFFGHEIPLITTKGIVTVVDAQGKVSLEKYVDTLISWQGATDLLTNRGIHKVWSEKFYFTKEPIAQEDFSYDGGTANALYTFEFTEDDFQNTGLPAKLDNIPIVSPCFYTASDATNKLNERVWGGGQFPATLSWDATTEKYIFKVRGLYPGNIMPQLQMYTKAYIHYQLETPYDEPAPFAMGISSGDTVMFTVDDSDWKTYLDSGLYNINSASADAMPTGFVYIPRNAVDACDGMVNAARMLNDTGSAGGDATVQGYSWIGKGDGVTDYTARIQSKLDELHTVSNGGTINLGPGTYPINGRLIIYGNTTIIGCGIKTTIKQTADNTDAIVVNGSNITLKDLCIKLDGACTEITACVHVNSGNPNGDNGYPSNMYVENLTMNNIFMSGKYYFEYVDDDPVLGDVYNNYKGVGIRNPGGYFIYAHIDDVLAFHLMTCVYGGGGSNYFNVVSEFCKYGIYIVGDGNNTYFVGGHSYYAINKNKKHISMSDAIAYVESGTMSTYRLACYDNQAFRSQVFLGPRARDNKIEVQHSGSSGGSWSIGHEWGIQKYPIVDYGRSNVYNDVYKNTPFHIGAHTYTISRGPQLEPSNPVIQNALSGAGIWGNISSNTEFENYGITLRDVCRYPSEKTYVSKYLPFILSKVSPSVDSPIEIVIDYSNRPVFGIPNYHIQFTNERVASDYIVSFDTTNNGVFDYELARVTDNTNVVMFSDYPQIGGIYTTYRMKITFTKALQITGLKDALEDNIFDYNPDGLIGICNIGMTVNDYTGRSFLGECGGSLYGNVDMHQNTLKNLPTPVDNGDAVSKEYLEEKLKAIADATDGVDLDEYELMGDTPQYLVGADTRYNIVVDCKVETAVSIVSDTVAEMASATNVTFSNCEETTDSGIYTLTSKPVDIWHKAKKKFTLNNLVAGEKYKIFFDFVASDSPNSDAAQLQILDESGASLMSKLIDNVPGIQSWSFTAPATKVNVILYPIISGVDSSAEHFIQYRDIWINRADALEVRTDIYNFSTVTSERLDLRDIGGGVTVTATPAVAVYAQVVAGNAQGPLAGKTCVCFGDSITGNYTRPFDYPSFIARKTGMDVVNGGFGGCRMAQHPSGAYTAFSMYNLADSIASGDWSVQDAAVDAVSSANAVEHLAALKEVEWPAVDYITIFYGTNDFTGGVPIGDDANSLSTSQYKGALRHSIETILTAYPNVRIVLLTPIYRFWAEDGTVTDSDSREISGQKLIDYVEAVIAIGDEYKLPVFNLYNSLGINKINRTTFLADGVHPSEAGLERIGESIAARLIAI